MWLLFVALFVRFVWIFASGAFVYFIFFWGGIRNPTEFNATLNNSSVSNRSRRKVYCKEANTNSVSLCPYANWSENKSKDISSMGKFNRSSIPIRVECKMLGPIQHKKKVDHVLCHILNWTTFCFFIYLISVFMNSHDNITLSLFHTLWHFVGDFFFNKFRYYVRFPSFFPRFDRYTWEQKFAV